MIVGPIVPTPNTVVVVGPVVLAPETVVVGASDVVPPGDVVVGASVVEVVDSVVVVAGVVVVVVASVVVVSGCVVVVDSVVVGATCGTVVDDVVGEVLLVVEVLLVIEVLLLVEVPGVGAGPGRRSTIGCGDSKVVGVGSEVAGSVVVVLVEVVIRTSELLGAMRSGSRSSVPSVRPPANRLIATMPTSARTTPLDAATIADCWRHHGAARGSYSSTSSASVAQSAAIGASASSNGSNQLALVGSGGGHIPSSFISLLHPAGAPVHTRAGVCGRHRSRCSQTGTLGR